jgi:altronate dehydratase small subunit
VAGESEKPIGSARCHHRNSPARRACFLSFFRRSAVAKVAMIIDKSDNVATCIAKVKKGETVELMLNGRKTKKLKARQSIPFAHKICVKPLKKGDQCLKYGLSIGSASKEIKLGDYIHVHNIESNRGRGDLKEN